jgi:CubicO group peptidase (beta-lactamase class C family)
VETPFDLASLTKPLVCATLAAILEAEGRWSLDDPAARWIPELKGGPYARVPLRSLGAHRGGLPHWHPLYLDAGDREGYLARIASLPPCAPPETTVYSDLGYLILGFAMERAASSTLDELFQARIARTLGLRRAGFAVTESTFRDAAATERGNEYERRMVGPAGDRFAWRTHVLRGEVHDANAWRLGGVAGHAGLFAPIGDVVRMAEAVLAPSKLGLDDSARDLWLRPVGQTGTRTFGWLPAVEAESTRGVLQPEAVGHFGFTGTSLWIEPDRGAIHVLLTNRVHPTVPSASFLPVRRGFHRVAVSGGGPRATERSTA